MPANGNHRVSSEDELVQKLIELGIMEVRKATVVEGDKGSMHITFLDARGRTQTISFNTLRIAARVAHRVTASWLAMKCSARRRPSAATVTSYSA